MIIIMKDFTKTDKFKNVLVDNLVDGIEPLLENIKDFSTYEIKISFTVKSDDEIEIIKLAANKICRLNMYITGELIIVDELRDNAGINIDRIDERFGPGEGMVKLYFRFKKQPMYKYEYKNLTRSYTWRRSVSLL